MATAHNILDLSAEILDLFFMPLQYDHPKSLNDGRLVCKAFKSAIDNLPQRKLQKVFQLVFESGYMDDLLERLCVNRSNILGIRSVSKSWASAINMLLELNPTLPGLRSAYRYEWIEQSNDNELKDPFDHTHKFSTLLAPIRTNAGIQNFLENFKSSSESKPIPGGVIVLEDNNFRAPRSVEFPISCMPILTRWGTHLSSLTLKSKDFDCTDFTGQILHQMLSSVPNVKRMDWYFSFVNEPEAIYNGVGLNYQYKPELKAFILDLRGQYDALAKPLLPNLNVLYFTFFTCLDGEVCRKFILWFGPQLKEFYLDCDDESHGEMFIPTNWVASVGAVSFDSLVKFRYRYLHQGIREDIGVLLNTWIFPHLKILHLQAYEVPYLVEIEEPFLWGHDIVQIICGSVGPQLKSLQLKYGIFTETPQFCVTDEDFVFPELEELNIYFPDFQPGFATNMPKLARLNVKWAFEDQHCENVDEFANSIWEKAGPSLIMGLKIQGKKYERPLL